MRKLLVKLVAAETALLGWLSYWLFLLYANNPGVSEGLSTQLSRFPQISYTTIDISIIVIIAIFSILLAVKFDRGLRPGMKLERALQMLENLMKRNLFLESQLAEIRGDKPAMPVLGTTSPTLVQPSGNTGIIGTDTMQTGSWEKAFRTPIEAGPSNVKIGLPQSTVPTGKPPTFDLGPRDVRPPIEAPPPREEKIPPKPSINSSWEDNPARTMETRGIITPSQPSSKKPFQQLPPPASVGTTTRLPYIPAPAPKAPSPPNVIVSAVNKAPAPPTLSNVPKPGLPAQARPIAKPSIQPSQSQMARSSSLQPLTTLTPLGQSVSTSKAQTEQTSQKTAQPLTPPAASQTREDDDELEADREIDEEDDDFTKKQENARKDKTSLFDEDSD